MRSEIRSLEIRCRMDWTVDPQRPARGAAGVGILAFPRAKGEGRGRGRGQGQKGAGAVRVGAQIPNLEQKEVTLGAGHYLFCLRPPRLCGGPRDTDDRTLEGWPGAPKPASRSCFPRGCLQICFHLLILKSLGAN